MIEQSTMTIQEKLSQYVQAIDVHSHPIFSTTIAEQAQDIFLAAGIPTTKHEEWKFTNLHSFMKGDIQIFTDEKEHVDILSVSDLLSAHMETIKAQMKGEEKGAYRLVLVDGKIVSELSFLPNNQIVSIHTLADSKPANLGGILRIADNATAALNTIMTEAGVHIHVHANQQLDLPLHVIHVYTAKQSTWYTDRAYIQLDKGAEASIIETYIAANNQAAMYINSACEIELGDNAQLKHYDIQKTSTAIHLIKRTEAAQGQHSNYSNYTFNLPGGAFFRNNLAIHIDHADTHCHLYGLYLTNQQQLVDNHTEVHHKFPNCESNQLYKGILLDQSKAVFNGKIFVYEDAQKTNAFQKSANLLLSDHATINAKPQLEIFADDVKCSHGSTIGQLDETAMFYLRSRGIGQDTAKKMLVTAFAYDVAEKVEHAALRHYLEEQIALEIN